MNFQRPKPDPPTGSGGASAYAKHRAARSLSGATVNAVKKAVESGRISPPPKKTGWFNFKKADREWKAHTQPQFQRIGTSVERAGTSKPARRVAKKGNSQGNSKVTGNSKITAEAHLEKNPTARLTVARAEKAEADAALATLQLHERASSLVSLKLVQDAVMRINRITRDALLTVPDRVASQVAACNKAGEVHEILLAEIRLALESLAEMPVEEFLEAKRAAAIREKNARVERMIQ